MNTTTRPYTMHYRAYYDDGSEIDFAVECDSLDTLQLASTKRANEMTPRNAGLMAVEAMVDEHPFHPLLWQSGNVFGYWNQDDTVSRPFETMFLADQALREYKMQLIALDPGHPYLESFCGFLFSAVVGILTAIIIPTTWWFPEFIGGYTFASILYYASLESWRAKKKEQ